MRSLDLPSNAGQEPQRVIRYAVPAICARRLATLPWTSLITCTMKERASYAKCKMIVFQVVEAVDVAVIGRIGDAVTLSSKDLLFRSHGLPPSWVGRDCHFRKSSAMTGGCCQTTAYVEATALESLPYRAIV